MKNQVYGMSSKIDAQRLLWLENATGPVEVARLLTQWGAKRLQCSEVAGEFRIYAFGGFVKISC